VTMDIKQDSVFSQIYKNHIWGSGSADSPLSGRGSIPDVAYPYVDFVRNVILQYKIVSVLDVGHGDWSMWRDYKFENTNYLGVDVAAKISDQNNEKYGNLQRKFVQIRASDSLPIANLILCKDVLQHLSLNDIDRILSQLSRFEHIILCNDVQVKISLKRKIMTCIQPRTRLKKIISFKSPFFPVKFSENNSDIETGGYRGLDLESPEFQKRFRNFQLLERVDYKFPKEDRLISRILFFKNSQYKSININ